MTRVLSYLPIILAVSYLFAAGFIGELNPVLAWAAPGAGFLSAIALWLLGRHGLASGVHKGMAIFMLLIGLAWLLGPLSLSLILDRGAAGFLYLCLLAAAALPPLFGGEMFTEFFARQQTSAAERETSIYRDVNRIMSLVWCGLFATCAIVASLPLWVASLDSTLERIVFASLAPMALLLGVGLPFTKNYPAYHLRRLGLEPAEPDSEPNPAPEPVDNDPGASGINQTQNSDNPRFQSSLDPKESQAQHPPKEVAVDTNYKIVAVNGSPHVGIGNTEMMLGMLGNGLAEHGAELELINLAEREIGYCVGCALCLEKGKCWQNDDQNSIFQAIAGADAVILASPVYVWQVTGQMKTFLDRSLPWGHRPRGTWKPGLSVSVAAAGGEREVADYLSRMLRIYGAYSIGSFTALAVRPGGFMGRDLVEARAQDLAADLVRAIQNQRRPPASGDDLAYWQFMSRLVESESDLMSHDHKHWQESGLHDRFENYVQQEFDPSPADPEMRKAWTRELIAQQREERPGPDATPQPAKSSGPPTDLTSCQKLIEFMPISFNPEAAADLDAVIQFDVSGDEQFSSHLIIQNRSCQHMAGAAEAPNLRIKTPADVWLTIAKGELDGQAAFMGGKYQVQGDMSLLISLNRLFARG